MKAALELDDQPQLESTEVRDAGCDRLLAPPAIAEEVPGGALRFSFIPAQLAGIPDRVSLDGRAPSPSAPLPQGERGEWKSDYC